MPTKKAATAKKATAKKATAKKATAKKATAARGVAERSLRDGPFDGAAISRVVHRIELRAIELVAANFRRTHGGTLSVRSPDDVAPDGVEIAVEFGLSDDGRLLGGTLTFRPTFDTEEPPYELTAAYRLQYVVKGEGPVDADDADQYFNWNGVLHAYPYYREFFASTLARAGLRVHHLPVLRIPRA